MRPCRVVIAIALCAAIGTPEARADRLAAPDAQGGYNVGFRMFQNVPASGAPIPRVLVYYPTTAPPNCGTRYTIQGVGGSYQRRSPLCAVENAEIASGPFPLVVHDHGGGPAGVDAQLISQLSVHETLASHGFVVVTFRHPATAAARMRDLPKVIDFMLGDDNPLSGPIDADRIGISGFSTGGRTSLAVTGGWPAQGIPVDPRIKAMVLYEPGRDSPLIDVATIAIPYLAIGGTRISNGTVTIPEVFDATVLATPRIRVVIPEAIHFNFQTDLCQAIEETREAALLVNDVVEPLTNMVTNANGLRTCPTTTGAAANQACTFWNQGELVVPLLGAASFGFGGGRNICNRVGVSPSSRKPLDLDPVDGFTDPLVPGTDIPLFVGNDVFVANESMTEPPPPAEIAVPLIKLYTVAFFEKFLAGDGRYMRYLTPGYANVHGLDATVEIRE